MGMPCSYSKGSIVKYLLFLFPMLFFINGCTEPKPYQYPNYEIIKPQKRCTPKRENIQALLDSSLGKPYVWAEEGPDAFDCSGLTYNIYCSMGVEIPRIAREQAKVGKKVAFDELIYGDLIFFGHPNKRSKTINHVGLYLGDGWFAHASSKQRKVTISHFEKEPIYRKRVKLCKRYLSIDERDKYMTCDAQLIPMQSTTTYYTTPWKKGMPLPKKAVPS